MVYYTTRASKVPVYAAESLVLIMMRRPVQELLQSIAPRTMIEWTKAVTIDRMRHRASIEAPHLRKVPLRYEYPYLFR